MWRRFRWVVLALAIVLVGALVAVALVEKPALDDDEHAVDTRWADLLDALRPRYAALDGVVAALGAAGEGERTVTQDLTADLAAWKAALDGGSATTQAELANRLEGQGARLRANIAGSARLAQNTGFVAALAAYDSAAPPTDAVRAYNRAVENYEDDRSDVRRALVAQLFGYDARPRFAPRA